MSPAAADRNLLFGILALQMDFIGRDALIAAMNSWVLDKARPLGQILLEQGTLAAGDHELLEGLVRRHLEKHGHNAERSLAALAVPEVVRADLRILDDRDLSASLAQLPPTPSEVHDSYPTTAPVSTESARFQVLRPHASGGLGEVFVARDGELHREVALKEIQARHADHPESRARFVREAEITGGLEHPGIVPVYALGQYPDGRPYYAMRFIRGDSLKDAIERFHRSSGEQNLELRQLLGRFIAVCNAIAYAHSRGVLHRDLKPGNIMLGEFGETLVVDWGLAKVLAPGGQKDEGEGSTVGLPLPPASADSELTQTGQALGTPAYMSPEQAAGRLDQLGPASDVYSLGATLYHLLTGSAPFPKEEAGVVLTRVQKGDFPPPGQVTRTVPPALEAICLRAMALDPAARYRSAKALAEDLEHWLADEAVAAYADPWPARLGRWMRHHRGLVGSLTAVVAVGLTVAVAGWLVTEARERQRTERELRDIAESEREEARKQKGEADTQRDEAQSQRKLANRYLYLSLIKQADRAWQEADMQRMDELLELTGLEQTGRENLAGFERAYLLRLRQTSLLTLKGHTSAVRSVAFSPDGQRLASASDDGMVKVWDARDGQESFTLQRHSSPVRHVAFSPDGKRLVSANDDGTAKIWDAKTGQWMLTLKGNTLSVSSLVFSPDGERLASASGDRGVKIWDAQTGQEMRTLRGRSSPAYSVAFSPDGQRLVAGGNGTLKLWDSRTGQEILTLKGDAHFGNSVAFSPDGRRLVAAGYNGTVKMWDAQTGQEKRALQRHSSEANSVAFSPDSQRLASAGRDQTVKIWDVWTGLELTLKGHSRPVYGVAFSPDNRCLASWGEDHTVRVWDARISQEQLILKGHPAVDSSVPFSLDSHGGISLNKLFEGRGGGRHVAFSPDGQRLASPSYDQTVRVWDARSGQETLTLKGHSGLVYCATFSPDGQRLASASHDGTVKVWDARTGQESFTFKGHSGPVQSVAFSSDGQRLASASNDGAVKIWDAQTGRETLTLKGHSRAANSVAFSPDGQRLASASDDMTVKVWDVWTGQQMLTLKGHSGPVGSVTFSPDGQLLASASGDQTVKIWDAQTGQERRTFKGLPHGSSGGPQAPGQVTPTIKGHLDPVYGVAFSPDGQRLASASGDMVQLWDASVGQEILRLRGNMTTFYSVAFSPDGQRLASADGNGTVVVWDSTPVSDSSNLQRQALSYFRFVAETVVLKDEVIQQIRETPTLSEPARELALAFARDYHEIPAELNEASWSVVRRSWPRPGAYPLALRQAEAACRHEPNNGLYLRTLGAAQYRHGQYAAALKTLTQSDKLHIDRFGNSDRTDRALLAMTYFQLGQKAEAAAMLAREEGEGPGAPPPATMPPATMPPETVELIEEASNLANSKQ